MEPLQYKLHLLQSLGKVWAMDIQKTLPLHLSFLLYLPPLISFSSSANPSLPCVIHCGAPMSAGVVPEQRGITSTHTARRHTHTSLSPEKLLLLWGEAGKTAPGDLHCALCVWPAAQWLRGTLCVPVGQGKPAALPTADFCGLRTAKENNTFFLERDAFYVSVCPWFEMSSRANNFHFYSGSQLKWSWL